jgi:hypothetical protein
MFLQAKAKKILETSAPLRQTPRTLALELKAELIRQLCDELPPAAIIVAADDPHQKVNLSN